MTRREMLTVVREVIREEATIDSYITVLSVIDGKRNLDSDQIQMIFSGDVHGTFYIYTNEEGEYENEKEITRQEALEYIKYYNARLKGDSKTEERLGTKLGVLGIESELRFNHGEIKGDPTVFSKNENYADGKVKDILSKYIDDYTEIDISVLNKLLKDKKKYPKELDPRTGGNKFGYRGMTFKKDFIEKLKEVKTSNGVTEYEVPSNMKITSRSTKGYLSFTVDEEVAQGFGHYSGYIYHKKSPDRVGGYVRVSLDNPNFILHPDYTGELSKDLEYSKESEKETLFIGTSFKPDRIYVVDEEIYNENYVLQDLEDKFDIDLDLHDDGKSLTLSRIVIPKDKRGEGIGTKVMKLITQYADAQNKPIYLTPSKDFGATSTGRLEQFYKQFGFKKKDRSNFSTKETMVREPQTSENYADGKVKGKSRPGRVKKSGASCKGSVTDLRAKAKKYGGEKGKMYHWCANMKGGKK